MRAKLKAKLERQESFPCTFVVWGQTKWNEEGKCLEFGESEERGGARGREGWFEDSKRGGAKGKRKRSERRKTREGEKERECV